MGFEKFVFKKTIKKKLNSILQQDFKKIRGFAYKNQGLIIYKGDWEASWGYKEALANLFLNI
jgi:argonaute-like protein implicated in RNA metabolism and viral defense